jgi:hypothetical protein
MSRISHRRLKHLAAAQQPDINRLLAALRQEWTGLSPAERGPRIRELLARGCTLRGLAADLGVTEGALRYDLKMASRPPAPATSAKSGQVLPSRPRGANQGGKSAAKVEQATNRILAWLDAELPELSAPYRERLLDEARRILWSAEQEASAKAGAAQPAPPRTGYRQVIEHCRPSADKDELWLSLYARWLGRWLWRLHPDPAVRDEALKRVERSPIPEKSRPSRPAVVP